VPELDENAFDIIAEEDEETDDLPLDEINLELDSPEDIDSSETGLELEPELIVEPELAAESDLAVEPELTDVPEIAGEIDFAAEPEITSGEMDSGVDLSLIPEGFVVESEGEEITDKSAAPKAPESPEIPSNLKHELKTVLSYMDQLLESLPDDKIEEFARSEHYDTYKKLFKELGLV